MLRQLLWQDHIPRNRQNIWQKISTCLILPPSASTPEEYGKYMIRQSGHFDYDENLDAFYDYEKYGTERMNAEDGMFTDRGYIAYKGYTSMEGMMNGSQSSHMEMGGLSR